MFKISGNCEVCEVFTWEYCRFFKERASRLNELSNVSRMFSFPLENSWKDIWYLGLLKKLYSCSLFTAADSDDIFTAIQFINKARPWSTLMGVGWGYGANMLTKYLAEVGAKTPLTAATCIDNPFDLEEATRLTYYRDGLDEKLTGGLIDILQSNKVGVIALNLSLFLRPSSSF